MGYDLHITRRENWFDEPQADDITLVEWIRYVDSDEEMYLYTPNNTEDGMALWNAHPKPVGMEDYEPGLYYYNGMVIIKSPDTYTIGKMVAIAKQLNAKVQGDDLEIYDEAYVAKRLKPLDPDAMTTLFNKLQQEAIEIQNANVAASKKPWWKFW